MSMYNDIVWGEEGNSKICEDNSRTVANHARRFQRGRWSFLGPGSEKKWYRTCSDKLDGVRDRTGEQMMVNFAETSHPIFRASRSLFTSTVAKKTIN